MLSNSEIKNKKPVFYPKQVKKSWNVDKYVIIYQDYLFEKEMIK